MPAILTHHLYGEDASSLLPEGFLCSQEELLSFLLGNQGTDPFWARFSTTPGPARCCHDLARSVHKGKVIEFLLALRSAYQRLDYPSEGLGRAFALGMAAHYLLDCMTHPLILALVDELCEADPELCNARPELHALIESDIDVWMLWQKRHMSVLEAPASRALASTARVTSIAGEMLSEAALETYDIRLSPKQYGKALRDYRFFYRIIDAPSARIQAFLHKMECSVREYSRIDAQRHSALPSDDCPSANLDHHRWPNPVLHDRSTASFADLFHDALLAWPTFAQRLLEGDRTRMQAMTDGLNYYGQPS